MTIYHITDALAATIATQFQAGKNLRQIARDMHIPVETASAALSKWSLLQRLKNQKEN